MAKAKTDFVLSSLLPKAITSNSTDRELIERFASDDKTAFAELVRRHTPLVLGVCQRVLPTVQDAEDACQAVFLVLARKMRTGRWKCSIANWLYTTARQVALRARRSLSRRLAHEVRAAPPKDGISPLDQMTLREALLVLDEELCRLPNSYREPLVLCYLQGLSREEAALRLGWTPGSVKARLERGRKRLSEALIRRGIVPGATLLATAVSPPGARAQNLFESIQAAVDGSPSTNASTIAREFLMHSIFTKAKTLTAFVAAVLGLGFALAAMESSAESKQQAASGPSIAAAKNNTDDKPKAKEPENAKPLVKPTPPYSLKEEEFLKLIPPTATSRAEVYQQLAQNDVEHERMLMVINSDGSSLKLAVASSRIQVPKPGGGWEFNGWSLHQLIENAFWVSTPTIIAEEDVLNTRVDADLLMRPKAPHNKLLASLAKELKAGGWGGFSIVERELEMPCVVAMGDYKQPDNGIVDLFADDRQAQPAMKGTFFAWDLPRVVANFIGVPIVDESSLSKLKGKGVTVQAHYRVPFTGATRAEDSDPEKVLKHLTEQTGLIFKLANRKQRFILIDRVDGNGKK